MPRGRLLPIPTLVHEQWRAAKFATQWNTEFFGVNREFSAKIGKEQVQGRRRHCAVVATDRAASGLN